MNGKIVGIVVLVLILIGIGIYYYMPSVYQLPSTTSSSSASSSTASSSASSSTASSSQGTVIFAMADKAANMGAVTSVNVTIDSVQVHSAAQGWVTLSSTPQTFDLLQLKASGNAAVVAKSDVQADNYDQVRLHVSNVVVTDINGTADAKVPSGDIRIVGLLNVSANTTSTALFDFLANESLHVTGNGKYILSPVIHLQTRDNANATADVENNLHVSGGEVDTDTKVGMDVNGNVGVGLGIEDNSTLSIDNNGTIKIGL